MLIDDIYRIGKEYNLKVKYNSNQGIPCIRKWVCANHIARLLESDLKFTDEQIDCLRALISKLVHPLDEMWKDTSETDDKAILLEQSLGVDLGIKTFYDELLICENDSIRRTSTENTTSIKTISDSLIQYAKIQTQISLMRIYQLIHLIQKNYVIIQAVYKLKLIYRIVLSR